MILPSGAIAALTLFAGHGAAQPFDCVIEPKSTATLVAADNGTIEAILVGRGERIAEGDVLVRLDDAIQQLQVELATARASSDIDLRAGQSRLALRRKELERARALEERNVAATTEVEEAEIQAALAALAVEEARTARRIAEIELAQAKALLKRRTITSPVDGVVTAVHAAPGEFAHEQLDILTVAAIDPLHVEVFLPTDYYREVSVGQTYQVRQLPPLDGEYTATVTVVDPIIDAASGTFGVQLEIANADGAIPAGTQCAIDFGD